MILSGIHGFKVWIPDYTLGNDRHFIVLNSYIFYHQLLILIISGNQVLLFLCAPVFAKVAMNTT
jgi:hypothetical protein